MVVALLSWPVGMGPPAPGLDASWNAGLAMAVEKGLHFGTDVAFSYGPLGFLNSQSVWFGHLAVIAFLYSAALYIVFCVALVWALRRTLPVWASALGGFLVVAALPPPEQSLLAAALVGLYALERDRAKRVTWALVIGGASFSAVEALLKLSTGPVIAVIFLITLIGVRARWWQLLLFAALTLAEVSLLWLLAGQSLATVPDFLANTWQIVDGYSTAMLRQVDLPAWQVTMATLAAAIVAIGLVLAALQGAYRDGRARWAAVALIGLASFMVFKEGVVRTDAGHLSLYFSTACVLWIAIPWRRARRLWLLTGAALIIAVGVPVRSPGPSTRLDVSANLSFAANQARSLFSSSRRAAISSAGRTAMKETYRLDRGTLADLRGHTVTVEPWEIGVAWAYRLHWQPLPVFQNYSAYTPALDRINARAVANPNGPERVLRENGPLVYPEFPGTDLDNRFPGWDPPAQARAVLCHFAPLHTTKRWQVLGRVADRCGPSRFIRSVEASPGAPVDVPGPGPGEAVFARIRGVGVSGLERITTFLWHARARHAVLNGTTSYRLIPETAGDGLLLRGASAVAEAGPFSPIPQAKTIAVTGAPGTLRFDFFAMPVGRETVLTCSPGAGSDCRARRAAAQSRHRGLRRHARRGAGTAALGRAHRHGRLQARHRVG
jgi:hypothetical protein